MMLFIRNTGLVCFPFILSRPQLVQPAYDIPTGPPQPALPPRQPNPTSNNKNILIDEATGEPIELYTGELITADNNPGGEDGMVMLSFASPDKQNKVAQVGTGHCCVF